MIRSTLSLGALALLGCGAAPPPPATPAAAPAALAPLHVEGADRAVIVLLHAGDAVARASDAAMADERFGPMSTFKIPNTLVALETGVATDEHFALPWDGVTRDRAEWNRDQTLETALRDSVVWFYQELARRAGHARMARLVHGMRYGNEDIGDEAHVDHFWLDGPLAISPREQVDFLRRLDRGELPVSARSVEILRRILPSETHGTAVLRAKTGTQADERGCLAWWVGWVEDGADRTYFATLLASHDATHVDALTSARKAVTREVLLREHVLPDASEP